MPSREFSSEVGSEITDKGLVCGKTLLQEMIIKTRLKIIFLIINRVNERLLNSIEIATI